MPAQLTPKQQTDEQQQSMARSQASNNKNSSQPNKCPSTGRHYPELFYAENTTGKHYKFYSMHIERHGPSIFLVKTWGRIDGNGERSQRLQYPSRAEALDAMEKVATQKLKRGYVET